MIKVFTKTSYTHAIKTNFLGLNITSVFLLPNCVAISKKSRSTPFQSLYINLRSMATSNGNTNNETNATDTKESGEISPLVEGHLKSYNTPLKLGAFQEVAFAEAKRSFYPEYRCAAHAMFYALHHHNLWNRVESPGFIMMQMRFDGCIGFPGGLVDPEDPDIITGLNRELEEEIGLEKNLFVQEKDHIISHVNTERCIVTHFFAKEVTPEEFKSVEKCSISAPEWGSESLGILRVPLYTMEDKFRGFPVFLANRFAGNARDQLLLTIRKRNILSAELLDKQLESFRKYTESITY